MRQEETSWSLEKQILVATMESTENGQFDEAWFEKKLTKILTASRAECEELREKVKRLVEALEAIAGGMPRQAHGFENCGPDCLCPTGIAEKALAQHREQSEHATDKQGEGK